MFNMLIELCPYLVTASKPRTPPRPPSLLVSHHSIYGEGPGSPVGCRLQKASVFSEVKETPHSVGMEPWDFSGKGMAMVGRS